MRICMQSLSGPHPEAASFWLVRSFLRGVSLSTSWLMRSHTPGWVSPWMSSLVRNALQHRTPRTWHQGSSSHVSTAAPGQLTPVATATLALSICAVLCRGPEGAGLVALQTMGGCRLCAGCLREQQQLALPAPTYRPTSPRAAAAGFVSGSRCCQAGREEGSANGTNSMPVNESSCHHCK
jgi:hypothetical protein